jgi:uncharacterized protein
VNSYIKKQFKYQKRLLLVALLVLAILQIFVPEKLSQFFSLGNLTAPANGVDWMGIAQGERWFPLGATLSLSITGTTFVFVFFQFRKEAVHFGRNFENLQWVFLFAATNSFSEEVIFRLGIIVPLFSHLENLTILLVSAVTFGALHLRGIPNGVIGAAMAGLLGWILAKSVIETNGIFWAWFIHFLQDAVIFYALVRAADRQKIAHF